MTTLKTLPIKQIRAYAALVGINKKDNKKELLEKIEKLNISRIRHICIICAIQEAPAIIEDYNGTTFSDCYISLVTDKELSFVTHLLMGQSYEKFVEITTKLSSIKSVARTLVTLDNTNPIDSFNDFEFV